MILYNRTYFNKTHKEIDEAIKSGTLSSIGYYHRGLNNALREIKQDNTFGKHDRKIKTYENKLAKLSRYIHDNKLYEQDGFIY